MWKLAVAFETAMIRSTPIILCCSQAECDREGDLDAGDESDNGGGDQEGGAKSDAPRVPIRADHITKIAAELLMDFS